MSTKHIFNLQSKSVRHYIRYIFPFSLGNSLEKKVGISSLSDVGGTTGSMSGSMLLSQTVEMILFLDQLKKELDYEQF